MSDRTRMPRLFAFIGLLSAASLGGPALGQNHLLISEVCVTPAEAEFIEIINPLLVTVDLSNYHIADNPQYSRRALGTAQSAPGDFVAQFPAGTTIPPGGTKVIAFSGGYAAHFGMQPDFELPRFDPKDPDGPAPNMISPYFQAVNFAQITDATASSGEAIILFYWDGQSDLVKDVDIIKTGVPSASDSIPNKSGVMVDGPDPDLIQSTYFNETPIASSMSLLASSGLSYKRRYLEGSNEPACGGNGITGHHEVAEVFSINWDGNAGPLTAPTPGAVPDLSNPPGQCFSDISVDNFVNINDLLEVINNWGACSNCLACPADISPSTCHDCTVNINDLLDVINTWGPCP